MYPNMMKYMLRFCPIWPRNETGLAAWYEAHLARARAAMAAQRCSQVLDTESPEAPRQLAALFPGVREACWGHSNRNKVPRPERTDERSCNSVRATC